MAKKRRKNPHAAALARLGARKGGKARMARMTPEERRAFARAGAAARWGRRRAARAKASEGATGTPGPRRRGRRQPALDDPSYVTYDLSGRPIYRFTGRYHKGPLADAFWRLARGESAAAELVAALAEHRRLPFRNSREHARLSACLRYQLHRFGWESLPRDLWDEIEEIVFRHPYCRLEDIGQEDRFLRSANGESTAGMGVAYVV